MFGVIYYLQNEGMYGIRFFDTKDDADNAFNRLGNSGYFNRLEPDELIKMERYIIEDCHSKGKSEDIAQYNGELSMMIVPYFSYSGEYKVAHDVEIVNPKQIIQDRP